MGKQIRDLEAELDEERKQKVSALNAKKKLEADFKDLESTMEMNNKLKEDALKQLKKLQVNNYFHKIQNGSLSLTFH
jgi:myosin protein heavy chain